MGELGVVECRGEIVRSEAAHKLHGTIISLRDARTIVLDLSEVSSIEGDGLGVLLFLQRCTHDHHIPLKLFDPTNSVRDRLERARAVPEFDIATLQERRTTVGVEQNQRKPTSEAGSRELASAPLEHASAQAEDFGVLP